MRVREYSRLPGQQRRHLPLAVLMSVACAACVSTDLAPPIVKPPVFHCSRAVGYSGATRDATLELYRSRSGTEEKVGDADVWLDWGEVVLPSTDRLIEDDIVTAEQKKEGRASQRTRAPVTARPIPDLYLKSPPRELEPPAIVPPLYECQKAVRVKDVLPGSTVTVRRNALPHPDAWQRVAWSDGVTIVTKSMVENDFYDAQHVACFDQPYESKWDPALRQTVGPVPKEDELDDTLVREPLVYGGDAIVVDGLLLGADIEIYRHIKGTAQDPTSDELVAAAIAMGKSMIFRLAQPLDDAYEYYAEETLCDKPMKRSASGGVQREVPKPSVALPLCQSDFHVTVCGTVAGEPFEVLVRGRGEETWATGNGGCVTLALRVPEIPQTGDRIRARNWVAGKAGIWSDEAVVSGPIAVPSYFDGRSDWGKMATEWPDVGVVILNPGSGPGTSGDVARYAPALKELRSNPQNQIRLLAYIALGALDAQRIGELKKEIDLYYDRYDDDYRIDGFFIDEAPRHPTKAQFDRVKQVRGAIDARAPRKALVVLRPRGQPDRDDYLRTRVCDVLAIFEQTAATYLEWEEPEWVREYPSCRFWHLVHSTSTSPDQAQMKAVVQSFRARHASWLYVTEQPNLPPKPWNVLPVFWQDLLKELRK